MESKETRVKSVTPEELTENILKGVRNIFSEFEEKQNSNQQPKYIDRRATSKKLGVTYVTLNSWDKKGILSKRKIGNRVFYLLSEIEEILESSK